MTETKFTPGPWLYNGSIQTIDGQYIADLSSPRGVEERDANARLIAMAPEMYEALEDALEQLILLGGDNRASPKGEYLHASYLNQIVDVLDRARRGGV